MTMAQHKLSILITILLLQILFFTASQAQCSLRIDYKVESKSKESSDVNVKSFEGTKDVKLQLYDLNSGQVVSEKEITLTSTYKTIFTNVNPSLYAIYIWLPGCKRPLVFEGEKHGILIEN
jgi:hypothetical protein